jgi:hypothetical protein
MKSTFVLWDTIDQAPVGGPALRFKSEDDAKQHLERMSAEEVGAGRYQVVAVPAK